MATRVDRWELDISGLKRSLREADQEIGKTDKGLEEMGDEGETAGKKGQAGGEALKVGMAAAAAAAAAAALAVKQVVTEVIDLSAQANVWAKQAKQFGTTAEEIQKVEGAFGLLTDGSVNSVRSIAKLQRAIAEAKDGVTTYTDEFAKLGIVGEDAIDKFASQSVTDQLFQIADAYTEIDDKASQTSLSANLLGDRMGALVPAFQNGSGAIREAIAEIEDAGLVSNETAAQSEGLQDALALLTRTWDTLVAEVLEPSIPVLQDVAEGLQASLKEAQKSGDVDDLSTSIAGLVGDVGDLVISLSQLNELIGPAIEHFKRITPPIGKVSDAVGKLTDKWDDLNEQIAFYNGEVGVSADITDELDAASARAAEGVDNFFGGILIPVRKSKDGFYDLKEEIQDTGKKAKTTAEIIAETARTTESAINDAALAEIEAAEKTTQAHLDELSKRMEARYRFTEEAKTLDEEFAEYQAALNAQTTEDIRGSYLSAFGSIERLNNTLFSALESNSDNLTDKQKEAALVGFNIQKAASIATATVVGIEATQRAVNAALSIASPAAIPLAIATGIAFGASTAANVASIASQQPPQFDIGGIVGAGSSADRVLINAQRDEAVINRQGVRNVGRDTIDRINAGGSMMDRNVIIFRTNNRVTWATEEEALRSGRSPYARQIAASQPTRVGMRVLGTVE